MDTIFVATESSGLQPLFQGLGVLIGIVIGVVISIAPKHYWDRREVCKMRKAFHFELRHNLSKLDEFESNFQNLSTYAAANNLEGYLWFFRFEEFMAAIGDNLLRSGQLFDFLSSTDVAELQRVYNSYIANNANAAVNQKLFDMMKNKDTREAQKFAAVWIERIKEHRKILNRLVDKA